MRILFSNDDGLEAPGLWHAWSAFPDHHREMVAPMQNQSGASHAFTLRDVLFAEKRENRGVEGLAISGYPADAVKFAIAKSPEPYDFVVSGINIGENGGVAQFYSGTVAAAREAALWGIPAVSISIWWDRPECYAVAAEFLSEWVPRWHARLTRHPLRPFFVNVNFPDCAPEEIRGVRLCRQSQAMFEDDYKPIANDPAEGYRLCDAWKDRDAIAPGTDDFATTNRYISIVPLTLDNTFEEGLAWLEASGEGDGRIERLP